MVVCGAFDALRASRQEYGGWYKDSKECVMVKQGLSVTDFCSTFVLLKQKIMGVTTAERQVNFAGEKLGDCWKRGRAPRSEEAAAEGVQHAQEQEGQEEGGGKESGG